MHWGSCDVGMARKAGGTVRSRTGDEPTYGAEGVLTLRERLH
jgi:hypothetical protein